MAVPTAINRYSTHDKVKYLSVSTEANFTGTISGAANFTTTGHHDSLTMMYNQAHQATTGTWALKDDGSMFCDQNQTNATCVYPLTGLKIGDEITGFKIVGAVGAASGATSTVDAVIKKVTKGSGAVTATSATGAGSTCSITQVSKIADYSMDESCTLGTTVTVATDYQYFILVTVSTANNAACDVAVIGVELAINRLV